MMTLETVVKYLQDEIKRAMPWSGHREAMKIALRIVRTEIQRKRRRARRAGQ